MTSKDAFEPRVGGSSRLGVADHGSRILARRLCASVPPWLILRSLTIAVRTLRSLTVAVRTLRSLTVAVLLVGLAGCNLFDAHVRQADLMRAMAADAATRLADGSIAQMSVSGQGLNPGVTVEAAIVYRATARYEGLAGQFSASGQGKYGRSVDPAEILKIVNDASSADEARRRIVERVIGYMGGTPVPPQTQPAAQTPPLGSTGP